MTENKIKNLEDSISKLYTVIGLGLIGAIFCIGFYIFGSGYNTYIESIIPEFQRIGELTFLGIWIFIGFAIVGGIMLKRYLTEIKRLEKK